MIDIGIEDVSSSASIFYTTLKNYTEMNDYLKSVVLNHRKEYPETNVTNVKSSWTSSYYTHYETDKFNSLIDEVCSVCECISGSHYNLESSYQPINMWAMMYEEGDFAIKHHHFLLVHFLVVIILMLRMIAHQLYLKKKLVLLQKMGCF
tara:strand:- start:77 stop:523 length:447 start_codon:yes stop_codon:yes gene_type:complete